MARGFKGEASFGPWTLRCDFNALCVLEEESGRPALDLLADLEAGKVSVRDMRLIVWCMMQEHHPDATLRDAGELLSDHNDALGKVLAAARPQGEAEDAPGNQRAASPQTAA